MKSQKDLNGEGLTLQTLRTKTKRVVRVLGLKWTPIGVKFSDNHNVEPLTRNVSICDAIHIVKKEKIVLTLNKETCACAGGRHFTGLEILPIEKLAPALTTQNHRVYESLGTALDSMRKQPQPAERGSHLVVGPLEKFEKDPDLILFVVTPAEADRILGLISFKGAEPFMYYPASSICSAITNSMAKGKPEINLISAFERKTSNWSPNELILTLPVRDFEEAVMNISESGYVK